MYADNIDTDEDAFIQVLFVEEDTDDAAVLNLRKILSKTGTVTFFDDSIGCRIFMNKSALGRKIILITNNNGAGMLFPHIDQLCQLLRVFIYYDTVSLEEIFPVAYSKVRLR